MHAWGLRLRRVATHSRYRTPPCCLPVGVTPSAPHISVFGAQFPACIYPCPTLQVQPHDCPRMARGQDGPLLLSCMTLTFTAPRRFIPTLSAPNRVFTAHDPDQLSHLARHHRPAWLAVPYLPPPEQSKALAMPGNHSRCFDDEDAGPPFAPDRRETGPQNSIRSGQFRPLHRPL